MGWVTDTHPVLVVGPTQHFELTNVAIIILSALAVQHGAAADEEEPRGAISWVMIFSKDVEQMITLRDVELISRIGTLLRSDVAN